MGICRKCGSAVPPGARSCPDCGAFSDFSEKQAAYGDSVYGSGMPGKGGASDGTVRCGSADIAENKGIAALSYLGVLVVFPLFMAKGSKFARHHAGQGLALLFASAAYSIVYSVFAGVLLSVSWELYPVLAFARLTGLAFPALAVFGIVNALSGKTAELPAVGKIRLLK